MRRILLVAVVLLAGAAADAQDLTLPAAASIVGGAPFFSDVRAFNTSYTEDLDVTATYRCFIGNPCPGIAPALNFTLGPRESLAFDDMVALTFAAPNTAGGVEFEHDGSGGQLVVTSRLYSTSPDPTVGMFIPGLENSEAHSTTVLTSIRNGGDGEGFRTNVGVFNREDAPVTVTFTIFDENGAQQGSPVVRNVPSHSGLQVSGIFGVAGAGAFTTSNGVIVVSATHEVFSYAAVIDNATTDPIFVVGAEDQPPQPITPGPSVTPTPPGATATPTQPGATPTRTPTQGPSTHVVTVGPGGSLSFRDQDGGNVTTVPVGTTVSWVWAGSLPHTSTADQGKWSSGEHTAPHTFTHTFNTPGTFEYACQVHGFPMTGTVIVTP